MVLYDYGFGSGTPIITGYRVVDLQTGAGSGGWLTFTSAVERPSGLVGGTPTAAVIGPGETAVYVGTSAGAVTALDAATGAVLWTVDVGAAVTQPPAPRTATSSPTACPQPDAPSRRGEAASHG